MQRVDVIYEYSEIQGNGFEDLKTYIIDTKALHPYFKLDWNVLKSKQYCGILSFSSKDYYLLPKISNHDKEKNLNIFTYMLMYVYDIKLHNLDISASKNHEDKNILELFIQLFARDLFKEFQAGIYKEYITLQDNLATLRGKY
ncbi:MAG: restriction endonuclease, partial [Campylobacterales bacterium]|nr:restriction endonuclease [Campylobacterales bacterium]